LIVDDELQIRKIWGSQLQTATIRVQLLFQKLKHKIMNDMIYLKGILVFCILLSGCDYIKFGKGVKNESDLKFKQHKLYFKSIPIVGEVLEKNICTDCNYNKYRIKIKLSNFIADTVNISFRSYEPFYVMGRS
jgi:hypothetical protein